MKKYVLIFLSMVFFACVHDNTSTIKYYQFTRDDLSHLYYDKDTLVSTGQVIHYKDSVKFLLNDSAIIEVVAETEIHSSLDQWTLFDIKEEDIYGSSIINFDKKLDLDFLISVFQEQWILGVLKNFFR